MARPPGDDSGLGRRDRDPGCDDPKIREGEQRQGTVARADTRRSAGEDEGPAVERDLDEETRRLARIERLNLGIVLALALASTYWRNWVATASLAAGAALVEASLWTWRWVLLKAFRDPERSARGLGCKIFLKIGLLILAVWALVVKVGVLVVPFALGIATFPLALLIEALREKSCTPGENDPGTGKG